MAVSVNEVEVLKEHFLNIVKSTDLHAPNVNAIIYSLLGFIILIMDKKTDLQIRSCEVNTGNILWFTTNGHRYAFRYENGEESIVIRKGSFSGEMIAKVNNSTTTCELKQIFNKL